MSFRHHPQSMTKLNIHVDPAPELLLISDHPRVELLFYCVELSQENSYPDRNHVSKLLVSKVEKRAYNYFLPMEYKMYYLVLRK